MDRASRAVTRIAFGLTSLLVMQAAVALAAGDAEIVFDPPKAVLVRKTDGSPARGELLRINGEKLWLRAVNGTEVDYKLEKVRSVKASDESFEFWPSKETFNELAGRIDKVGGAKLNGTVASPARTQRSQPQQTQPRKKPRRGDDDYGESSPATATDGSAAAPPLHFGDNARPAPAIDDANGRDEDAGTEAETEEATADADSTAGAEVLICSNCDKELPAAFKSGDKCPHCSTIAVFQTVEVNPFAATTTTKPAHDPFAAAAAPPAAAIPAAPGAAAPVVDAGAGGLAGIPLLGKVGIFAAFVIVGWFILQRR